MVKCAHRDNASYMSSKAITGIILLALIIAGLIGLFVWRDTDPSSLSALGTSTDMSMGDDSAETRAVATSSQPYRVTKTDSGAPMFQSNEYQFAFQYPKNYTVSAFDDRGGHMVMVKSPKGEDAIQIFITSWDEPADALTPKRIKQDLPDLTIREPKKMSMSGDNYALTFVGESESFGTTREVWFVHNDHLYQVIAPVKAQSLLSDVLETWRNQ